jgi:uncharacterized protein
MATEALSTATTAAANTAALGDTPSKDDRTMALLAHLLGITVIGSVIVWVLKKDQSAFVDDQGKEAVNFTITALIGYVGMILFSIVTLGFGALLFPVYCVAVLVFCILAAIKANEGVQYRYPINLRLIK